MVLLAGAGGGALAARLVKAKAREKITGLANTFAGGVFLGAALLHMLPDAISNFESFAPDIEYPLFALTAGASFLLVLMLDKVLAPSGAGAEKYQGGGAVYPYILMLTLSVHSIITGIALGLEDHLISAAAILFAVLAHKSTAALALAISFNKENIPAGRTRNLL